MVEARVGRLEVDALTSVEKRHSPKLRNLLKSILSTEYREAGRDLAGRDLAGKVEIASFRFNL